MLSVILICKNEEAMIRDCLLSVCSLADEIIVLDSGSTDKTLDIAREYTSHIYQTDWPGFGIQKNRALAYATGDWILSLDADERVSPNLAKEIKEIIKTPAGAKAYQIKFESYFLGKKIRFGDWRGESHVRLFRKDSAEFDNAILHENLKILGDQKIEKLKNPIEHFSYIDSEEIERKLQDYALAGAEKLRQQGKAGGFYLGILKGLFAFIRGYLIKLGFLDGLAGLKLAWMNARYTFRKYAWVK